MKKQINILMNLAYMNKFRYWLITIVVFVYSSTVLAQDINSFWTNYANLRTVGNHHEAINLLHKYETAFESSGNVDKFIYHLLLADSQLMIKDIDDASKSLVLCDMLIKDMTSEELQYCKDNDTLNIWLAKYYFLVGNQTLNNGLYQTAETNLTRCYNILLKRQDHEKLELFRTLHLQLGLLYIRLNNIPYSLRYLNDAKLGSEVNQLFDNIYSRTLLMLGIIYLSQEEFLKAKIYFDEAMHTLENFFQGELTDDFYTTTAMLGSCYLEMGYKKEAKEVIMKAIDHCKKNNTSTLSLSHLYSALGSLHISNGDYISAKAIFKEAYNISKGYKSNSAYNRLLESSNLAIAQYLTNDSKYKKLVEELSSVIIEDVVQQFSFLSADERTRYWEQNSDYLSKFNAMLFLGNDNRCYDQIYNNTIFSKGLLLRTTNYISEQITKTENKNLQKNAKILQILQKKLLSKEMGSQELHDTKDSIRQIEKELTINLIGYQSIDSIRKQYSFQNVKHSLTSNEVAIEFIKLPELTMNADSTKEYYAAIIFQSSSPHPNIVRLCSEDTLLSIQQMPNIIKNSGLQDNAQNELYRQYLYGHGDFQKKRLGKKPIKFTCVGDSLYKMIWKPLECYLQGISIIYYSTSGQLNSIAFNALPVDSVHLTDRYTLCYLSSTSEIPIVKSKSNKKPVTASLYGGINYDTSTEEMQNQSRGYNCSFSRGVFERDTSNKERGSWGFLPGSQQEVTDVSTQLTTADITNKLFTSSQANEESFKANSGDSPNLFHIATHGFFYPDKKDEGCQAFLRGIKGLENVNHAQAILNRAGILFSGANRAWRGEDTADGIDDGILTAEEVSHLNLGNTDMVVLSACETGLGENVASEGVFGLQRAFKLAGVQTLVMSLWKVPDAETSELMTLFYNNWLNGMNKHEAFQSAQRKIKENRPNPYFWAGFIMLD